MHPDLTTRRVGVRGLALGGVAAVVLSLAVFGWLHVAPASAGVDWRTRTLSQYALLENGWAFDVAVLLLAAGSAAVLAGLMRAGLLGRGAVAGLALWVAGLVGVVLFEKHNWATGPSISGDVHRVMSLIAFLSLPVAALLSRRRSVMLAGVIALLCFTPILWALVSEPWTGVRWWHAIPLGGVERLLGAAEVATILLMARWAIRADPDNGTVEQAQSG